MKNFDLLSQIPNLQPQSDLPDLRSVVDSDLVVDRSRISFVRDPSNEVGRGASAVVYSGIYDTRPVAVKCIRTMSDTFTREDRLRRELRNASTLKSPYIVEFRGAAWDYEAGPASPKNVLLVTELMHGGNLRESLNVLNASDRQHRKLSDSHNNNRSHAASLSGMDGLAVDSFLIVALQVARGIEYLHQEGLAHRDIKSPNVLLTERITSSSANQFSTNVRAKIADFGLSKYIDRATGGGTVMQTIMEPGRLEATYSYLAPEAFGGDKSNVIRQSDSDDDDEDARGDMAKKRDIYALGVLFWEMLTAHIPWAGVSLPDVYVRVCVRSDRPAPALDDARVSKSVRRLVERCWAQNPAKRPSARSIVAKLEKLAMRFGLCEEDNTSSPALDAAAEAVSVVSAAAPNARKPDHIPDVHSDPIADQQHHHHPEMLVPQRDPSDSVRSYPKMPSASTVYTTPLDGGSKTHSTGFEASDARDIDRIVEDLPAQYDDNTWIHHDGDTSSKTNSHRLALRPAGSTSLPTTNGQGPDAAENGPGSLNRRLLRPRQHVDLSENDNHSRSHGQIPPTPPTAAISPTVPSPNPSTSANAAQQVVKSSATAVAATAAAIAAAKDRERKRDDARATRPGRVQRPPPTNPPVDSSFQSLPNAMEVWHRGVAKDRNNEGRVFYDNSDEEAQAFDPERAAAEEAMAQVDPSQAPLSLPRHAVASRAPATAIRSASTGRVGRPKSPLPSIRRPMSPTKQRPFSPVASHARSGEDEMNLSKPTARATEVSTTGRKSLARAGRLGRTLSSAKHPPSRPMTPVVNSKSKGIVTSASATTPVEASSKRPFIRRMRSNETSRRMARSSSSTGAENRRAAAKAPLPHTVTPPVETMATEEEEAEYSVMQIGSGSKEDFAATVNELDKVGLLRLFAQRMPPLRQAALALAALHSSKHRLDEESLRHSCAILHRLTVPNNAAQKSNGQEVSPKGQLGIRRYLKSAHAVEALLQALHPPQIRHPTTLSYGLLALGNLTAWDLEAHKQFRSAHGVLQITNVMKTHAKNAGVQEKGCYALACVGAAYPPKSKPLFEQTGALDVVIDALSEVKKDQPNDAVMKQACAALGAMCSSSPANALYSGRKDALAYLVTAFERFRRASKTNGGKRSEMRLVCKAFIDLLCHAENRKIAGSKGGSTMIIRAMRIFRLDSDFIEKGLTTLAEFCTHKSNGAQIVQASGVDDIVASMERFPLSVNMQREGTRVLTLLMMATGDQARRRLIHVNGAEAIVVALERFGAVSENNIPVVVETCRTLHMLFMMENSSEGEKVGKRMKKIGCDKIIKKAMNTHRQNQAVQEKGRDALKQLGNIRGMGGWGFFRKR